MTSTSASQQAKGPSWLVWYLLLPVTILAWPRPNLLARDFATTEITGVALSALVLIPLLAWLLLRRPLPSRGSLLLFVALFVPHLFVLPTDTLERSRSELTALVAIITATGAAALGESGRLALVRGLASLSLFLTVPALLDGSAGWGGVLGNSGELSGAALPGALCGMLLWSRDEGRWRLVGMTALGLFILHALLAPVISGLLVLALVSLVSTVLGRSLGQDSRSKIFGTLLISMACMAWIGLKSGDGLASRAPSSPARAELEAVVPAPAAPPTSFGGVEVRWRIWLATLEMFSSQPLLGVGTGQFPVVFPDYRDPRERELSNFQRRLEANTEVENPHSDWLLPWAEGGVIAGLAWWSFLAIVLLAAWRSLKRTDLVSGALAAASLGAVAGAAVNAPLLYNPLASVTSFLVIGALLGPIARPPAAQGRRPSVAMLLTIILVVMTCMYLPRAWNMTKHGAAIASLIDSSSTTDQGLAVAAALEACPDSPVALSLQARLLAQQDGDLEAALESWKMVRQLRPLRLEAWMQSGVLLARMGQLEEARAAFDRAVEIDAGHPGLARNRVRCFAESGMMDEALAEIDRLEELGHSDPMWLLDLSVELILTAHISEGVQLLARTDERLAELGGERAWALEAEYRRSGNPKVADALRSLAHVLWAREQAAAEQWQDAKRSYFQALRIMRDYTPPAGPLYLRLEYASALWQGGRQAEASEEIKDIDPDQANLARLPAWAGEALFEMSGSPDER
jgi:tetratricopeptide (TPR) repeat protein